MAEALEPRTFSIDQLPCGDGVHACRADQLAAWLVDYGLASRTVTRASSS